MGKGSPSPPPAPDPVATAAAQTASNVETAKTQAALNRVNQYTPQGSVTWSQDPNNPLQYTSLQQYSPSQQHLYDLSTQAQGLYGNTALNQLGQAAGSLSNPINTDYSDVRNQYIQSQLGLIQPQMDQQHQALESKLANQGVAQGSTAYGNAMRDFTNQQSQMYANILGGAGNQVGQAIQQQESLRDQPLNEAASLLTGQQVQQPNFTAVPQSQMAPTDVLGAYGQQQSALQNAYNQQIAGQSAAQGGQAALIGTIGSAAAIAI
jgi:hypothetical protein